MKAFVSIHHGVGDYFVGCNETKRIRAFSSPSIVSLPYIALLNRDIPSIFFAMQFSDFLHRVRSFPSTFPLWESFLRDTRVTQSFYSSRITRRGRYIFSRSIESLKAGGKSKADRILMSVLSTFNVTVLFFSFLFFSFLFPRANQWFVEKERRIGFALLTRSIHAARSLVTRYTDRGTGCNSIIVIQPLNPRPVLFLAHLHSRVTLPSLRFIPS